MKTLAPPSYALPLAVPPLTALATIRPPVSVVIATCGRPQLLRNAVRSILDQDYAGWIELLVVFDRIAIDPLADVEPAPRRTLRLLGNSRSPGLAGGRNTGILAARGEYVAFCDDDDEWAPAKLTRQLDVWLRHPDAVAAAAGITIRTGASGQGAGSCVRIPPERTDFADFLESRITAIHPSTLVYRRADLLERVGLVDEALPASYGEDYDLLLRATRHGHVRSVPEPLVLVHWDRPSFFAGKWENIAAGLTYLLDKFPEFESTQRGTARIAGQVAFAHAALGHGRECRAWARSALARDARQLRAYAALAVGCRLVSAQVLLDLANRRGHGL
jgi:glycosyltransferase involved in cell wall biosynthesis